MCKHGKSWSSIMGLSALIGTAMVPVCFLIGCAGGEKQETSNGCIEESRREYMASAKKFLKDADPPFSDFCYAACVCGDVAFLSKMQEKGQLDFYNPEYIKTAALFGQLECCKYLIKCGADVNAGGPDPDSVLYYAVKSRNFELCKYLIEHGAKVNAKCWGGITALHHAADAGDLRLCELLDSHGADVNAKDDMTKSTVLHWAVCSGNTELCKYLMEHGANVRARDGEGKTALHNSASFAHIELCKIMIKHVAEVRGGSFECKNEEICDLLLSHGAKEAKLKQECMAELNHLTEPPLKDFPAWIKYFEHRSEILKKSRDRFPKSSEQYQKLDGLLRASDAVKDKYLKCKDLHLRAEAIRHLERNAKTLPDTQYLLHKIKRFLNDFPRDQYVASETEEDMNDILDIQQRAAGRICEEIEKQLADCNPDNVHDEISKREAYGQSASIIENFLDCLEDTDQYDRYKYKMDGFYRKSRDNFTRTCP